MEMYKYNQPLKSVWTARLSPVMRAADQPLIRPPVVEPITREMGALGSVDPAPVRPVRPRNRALWSDLHRIGAAGALSRVRPFGPDAFSGNPEGESSNYLQPFLWGAAGAIIFMAARKMLS